MRTLTQNGCPVFFLYIGLVVGQGDNNVTNGDVATDTNFDLLLSKCREFYLNNNALIVNILHYSVRVTNN